MGVKATHKDFDRYSPKWQRMRDVICGQDAMHTAGERYLPKLKNEEADDYKARVKRSDFFNGTWRTIDALGGMVFRKPPTSDIPAGIESYLEDVTLSGMSMESLAKEVTEEVLGLGRIGILVDHPPQPENVTALTVEAAQRLGLRPTLQLYMAESIRNWKFSRINNAWVLSQVVLGEKHEEPKDEFESEPVDRYRVLDLGGEGGTYRQRVFEVKDEKDVQIGGDIVPLMNNKPLDFIPFTIAGAGGANDAIDEPPLIDLADKNVAHYQVNSDYRHGGHMTALPTLFLAGVQLNDGEKLYIGGSAAITSSDPNAKGEFIEYQGQGLQALEKMLDRLERQMALLGARMIADETTQAETLGATQIKRAGENSVLAKIVTSVSESLEWALGVFAKWAGHEAEIVYQLNRDFLPAMMDAQQLNALFAGVTSGNISKREMFELLKRGDVIDGEVQWEDHQREIDEEAPTLAQPRREPPLNDDQVAA